MFTDADSTVRKCSVTFYVKLFGFIQIDAYYCCVFRITSLSRSTRDFLKLSFHMFPYNEILKVLKSKI